MTSIITDNTKNAADLPLSADKVTFADESASALLKPLLGELHKPAEAGWQKIKQNASRTVYRKQVEGKWIYLKHYHSRTFAHRIGRLLGVSDAMCEMHFSRYLSERGIETAPALAAVCCHGAEWLATLGVEPADRAHEWQLDRLTEGAAGSRQIRRATVALAEAIGKMHTVGVIHCDLHAGNILIRSDSQAPRVVLMDLHRMKQRRKLSRRARVANLAQLFHGRFDWTTRTDRLRFLKHYLRVSKASGSLRGWQYMIEEFAWRHRRRLFAKRDRRIASDNRYFKRVRLGGGWRGHVVLASKRLMAGSKAATMVFDIDDWRKALADPEQLLAGDDVQVIKDTRSGRVVQRKLTIGETTVDVFIKSPRRKYAWKALLNCFRPAKPIRAFRLGHALLTRRIATALPLAAIERRVGPLLMDSILITEAVQGQQLNTFLNTWLGAAPASSPPLGESEQHKLAQDVLWQMGRMLQRLHDSGFHHRDLKGQNMLVQWSRETPPEIILLDLDGLHRVARVTARQQFQGLMRLNVSLLRCPAVNHPGQLRMLLGYLRRPGAGRIHFKPYWRTLETWSAKKLRQQITDRRKKQKASRR